MNRADITPSSNVSRCIFARGDSDNDNESEFPRDFGTNMNEKSNKWNFDFKENVALNKDNGLQWVPIDADVNMNNAKLLASTDGYKYISMNKHIIAIKPMNAKNEKLSTMNK